MNNNDILLKFEKSINTNINILNNIDKEYFDNEKEKDDLKMRHISKFFDKLYKRKYIKYIPLNTILKEINIKSNNIIDFRTRQMFKILNFYLSNKKEFPQKISDNLKPIIYYNNSENYNKDLALKCNIFINDDEFDPIKNNLLDWIK